MMILFKLSMVWWETLHFDTSLIDLDLDSRSQEWRKQKTFGTFVLHSFQSIWMEFDVLLRLAGVMKFIFILSCLVSYQGGGPYLWYQSRKLYHWLVFRHLQTDFFQTRSDDRDYKALYIDITFAVLVKSLVWLEQRNRAKLDLLLIHAFCGGLQARLWQAEIGLWSFMMWFSHDCTRKLVCCMRSLPQGPRSVSITKHVRRK